MEGLRVSESKELNEMRRRLRSVFIIYLIRWNGIKTIIPRLVSSHLVNTEIKKDFYSFL